MTLDILLDGVARQRSLKEKADLALQEGKITPAEHAFFLRKELGEQPRLRSRPSKSQQSRSMQNTRRTQNTSGRRYERWC